MIPADAIVVSNVSFEAADPQRIVVSNAAFVDALFAEHLTADEIGQDALRSYFVQYYLAQMENGGFAQFVYNSDWDSHVVAKVRDGLRTIGALMHQAVFLEGVTPYASSAATASRTSCPVTTGERTRCATGSTPSPSSS